MTNTLRPHPYNLPAGHFLIVQHGLPDFGSCPHRHAVTQPCRLDNIPNLLDDSSVADTLVARKIGLLHQPYAYGLSMDQRLISTQRFTGMPDRMAIIQNSPSVRLSLIVCNHFRLDLTGPFHHGRHHFWIPLS